MNPLRRLGHLSATTALPAPAPVTVASPERPPTRASLTRDGHGTAYGAGGALDA